MLKEIIFAVSLTLLFSFGVGVLFVRTLIELFDIVWNRENQQNPQQFSTNPKKI